VSLYCRDIWEVERLVIAEAGVLIASDLLTNFWVGGAILWRRVFVGFCTLVVEGIEDMVFEHGAEMD
jgi:hypothetical protein